MNTNTVTHIIYFIGLLLISPMLPLLYIQGKRVKKRIPRLSEARNPRGNSTTAEESGKGLKMVVIGESTMAGVGVETHDEGFSGCLAGELSRIWGLDVEWSVHARSGYTVQELTEEILPEIHENGVDLIVVGVGANDAFALNSTWKWKIHITKMIKNVRLRYPTAAIVFSQMPPIKEFTAFTPLMKFVMGNLVELYGRILERITINLENVHYVNEVITINSWAEKFSLEAHKSEFFSDGVHPSRLTYETWAKDMAKQMALRSELKEVLL